MTAGALLLAGLGATSQAHAQTASGWALNRFDPTPAGEVFFFSEHPWYSSTRSFAAGLVLDYASNPLVLRQDLPGGGTRDVPLVSDMLTGHLGLAVSFLDRIGISASLPISLYQAGDAAPAGTTSLAAAGSVNVADLRAAARVRLFGHADRDAFSLHIGLGFWAPSGSRAAFTGDDAIRIEPRLIFAGRGGIVRWGVTGGFTLRDDNTAVNLAVGNEVRASASLGFVFDDNRLTVGPEVYVVSSVRDLPGGGGNAFFSANQWGGEAILSAHYQIANTILVGAGGGIGMEQGYGIPAARGILSVAYAPVPPRVQGPVDTDGDGVMDPDDLCVTVPMGDHPDPNRRGCPAQDSDGDGVYDHEDQCVMVPMGDHPDPNRRGCPLADRDGDGVFDPDDVCVDVPQGPNPDPERRGCPDGDRDNDGVRDHADQCPDVPQGNLPDPQRPGCPLPDRDGDYVPDATDHCPDQPGAPSSNPVENGCPVGVRIEQGHISILTPVFFDTDRDVIKPQSFRVLERVADVLRALPQIRRVAVEGHTDNRASHDHNIDLSQRRAVAVMRFLTEHGVDAGRLEAHGYGPDRAIATNNTALGRARNRRVEFLIVDPAQPAGIRTGSAATADPGTPVDSR